MTDEPTVWDSHFNIDPDAATLVSVDYGVIFPDISRRRLVWLRVRGAWSFLWHGSVRIGR